MSTMTQGRTKLLSVIAATIGCAFSLPSARTETYEVKKTDGIPFAEPDGVKLLLDLHLPKGVESPPLVMFIHGGGWSKGGRNNSKLNWVAQHGYALASIEYRLSQEALFPAQILDCKGALRWLRANQEKYGYDASRVVVAGTSAGGHLAALMGTSGGVGDLEGETGGNSDQSSRVQGILDYYGPSDFVARSENQPSKTDHPDGGVFKLLGGPVKENLEAARRASPVTYISKDDPPLLILHGDRDKTVFLDQSQHLEKLYREAGLDVHLHVIEGAGHGWKKPYDEEKIQVLAFLERILGQQSPEGEPTTDREATAREAAEKAKAAAATAVEKKYLAHVATLPADEQAWEKTLQENLGGFYLPIHQRQKIDGKSNAWDFVRDDPALPRVLLIGDSVSRGYTQATRKALAGQANLHRAPANCGPTSTGLKKIDVWLGDPAKKWDIIHFNFGIHDRNTPLADYAERLEQLVARMKKTGARLIWASTTPIPDLPDKKQTAASIVERNAAAAEIMDKHGVATNDLFTAVTPHLAEYQNPDDVHFNSPGYQFLGSEVAKSIEATLK